MQKLTCSMQKIPFGTMIPNMENYFCPIEEDIFELYISGIGVTPGYLKEKNNDKFTIHEDKLYFKTGDLYKKTDQGYVFFNRRDRQVKKNGKRIDFSEIENIVYRLQNIKKCIATSVILNNRTLILLFIESNEANDKVKIMDILKENLPEHYLPNFIEIYSKFEYLPNRKINVNAMIKTFIKKLEGDTDEK